MTSRLRTYALVAAALCVWITLVGTASGASSSNTRGTLDQKLRVNCSSARLANGGYLTVATNGTFPPDVVIRGNKIGGLEGPLIAALAHDCGLKLKLYQTTFASMILAVQQHKADMGMYVYYSPERAKRLYYTFPHWVADRTVAFTRSDFSYSGWKSCQTAATAVGFVWAPYLQTALGGNAKLYPDPATGGTALLNGQVDCWINTGSTSQAPPFKNATDRYSMHVLHNGDFGMPAGALQDNSYNVVACDNISLARAMNAELTNLVRSGAWAKNMKAWKIPKANGPILKPPKQYCG